MLYVLNIDNIVKYEPYNKNKNMQQSLFQIFFFFLRGREAIV